MLTINPRQIIGAPAGTRNPIDILKIRKHMIKKKELSQAKGVKIESPSRGESKQAEDTIRQPKENT